LNSKPLQLQMFFRYIYIYIYIHIIYHISTRVISHLHINQLTIINPKSIPMLVGDIPTFVAETR
jgi:hypothetical protein